VKTNPIQINSITNWRRIHVFKLFFPGFLNANGSPLTRGQVANYGIMDQMAVLQWIQENIVQFGGDPQKVTLFGHGTGAACIEYLTHSPTTVPGKNFNPIFIGLVEDYICCSGQKNYNHA
jgi:hypothetical protein